MTTASSRPEADIAIQRLSETAGVPADERLREWARLALGPERAGASLCLRIVDQAESRSLNRQWRGRDQATNVLSFPSDLPAGTDIDWLGDIVLCAPVIEREAREQDKQLSDHWAHLVIHGILHLLGFDHTFEQQAEEMEAREIELLHSLGIADPYGPDRH